MAKGTIVLAYNLKALEYILESVEQIVQVLSGKFGWVFLFFPESPWLDSNLVPRLGRPSGLLRMSSLHLGTDMSFRSHSLDQQQSLVFSVLGYY